MSAKFAKIKPSIWRAKLKALSATEKLLAMYLMTNDRFQMVGIYHLPKIMMVQETGLTESEVDEGLKTLRSQKFAQYDCESEFVWVMEMARTQVADGKLSPQQKKGIVNELSRIHQEEQIPFLGPFLGFYKEKYDFLPSEPESLGTCLSDPKYANP